MADTFASVGRKVETFRKEMTSDALGHALGKMAKDEATKAASADLGGDPKFSGWNPTLDTRYDILEPGKVLLKPTPRSAGPWTVAQQGRNQGNASGFAGPSINRKTGATSFTKSGAVRRSRGARARRWNGRTQGKGTADDARAAIEKKAPGVVETQIGRAIRKTF
jgi:hypothetical protein